MFVSSSPFKDIMITLTDASDPGPFLNTVPSISAPLVIEVDIPLLERASELHCGTICERLSSVTLSTWKHELGSGKEEQCKRMSSNSAALRETLAIQGYSVQES